MTNPFLTEPDRVFEALGKIENHSDIARLAGVHPSTITKMAAGQKRNPTISVMARIYKALCEKGLMDTSITKKTNPAQQEGHDTPSAPSSCVSGLPVTDAEPASAQAFSFCSGDMAETPIEFTELGD